MDQPHFKHVSKYEINQTLSLVGYSVAGHETAFYIKELGVMLDCGVVTKLTPEFIFLTHGHMDHSGQIHKILADIECTPLIIVPKKIEDDVVNAITGMFKLSNRNPKLKVHDRYKLIGVHSNSEVILNIRKRYWKIDIIHCFHSVPTNGFGFTELRNKLKSEYKELSGSEIAKLKKEGIEVTNTVEYSHFCFLGDTDKRVLENEVLLKFPLIMIECTFLYPEHKKEAAKTKHMHWIYLEPFIRLHPEIRFILFHFSARYTPYAKKDNLVKEFFNIYTDRSSLEYIPNLYLWI